MKIILIIILIFPLNIYSWGGYAGVNQGIAVVNASSSNLDLTTTTKNSYTFGFFENFNIGKKEVDLKIALQYVNRSFQVTNSPPRTYSFDYLELPLLFKFDMPYAFLPNFIFGPNLGWLVSKKCTQNNATSSSCTSLSSSSINYGIDLGLNLKNELGFVELRYYLGLNDIDQSASYKTYHRGYMLLMGVNI